MVGDPCGEQVSWVLHRPRRPRGEPNVGDIKRNVVTKVWVADDGGPWDELASRLIGERIRDALRLRGHCRLMLTGGDSARRVYSHLAQTGGLPAGPITILLGDERCVPPDHPGSNYGLVLRTLFPSGVPSGASVIPMWVGGAGGEGVANGYEELLRDRMDVLLLGVGSDGHVASLFPEGPGLEGNSRTVLSVRGPEPFVERLTITVPVVRRARQVFLLAPGAAKGKVLSYALQDPADTRGLPVRMTIGREWLLDSSAVRSLRVSESDSLCFACA